jgi:hypothetical protein
LGSSREAADRSADLDMLCDRARALATLLGGRVGSESTVWGSQIGRAVWHVGGGVHDFWQVWVLMLEVKLVKPLIHWHTTVSGLGKCLQLTKHGADFHVTRKRGFHHLEGPMLAVASHLA